MASRPSDDSSVNPGDAPSALSGKVADSLDPSWGESRFIQGLSFLASLGFAVGLFWAPGVRGNANEGTVLLADGVREAMGGFLYAAMTWATARGVAELRLLPVARVKERNGVIVGVTLVVLVATMAVFRRLLPVFVFAMVSGAIIAGLRGAIAGLRQPSTRGAGFVVGVIALSAAFRIVAFQVAALSTEQGNDAGFFVGRLLATTGALFEGMGQLGAIGWMGAKARWPVQAATLLAVLGAFVVTWGAAVGVNSDAVFWQNVAHTALTDASSVPLLGGGAAFAVFLMPASILLAAVFAWQPSSPRGIPAMVAFALLSRGAFDLPLRAMAAAVAGIWISVAAARAAARSRTQGSSEEVPASPSLSPS